MAVDFVKFDTLSALLTERKFGELLFTRYAFAFEITAVKFEVFPLWTYPSTRPRPLNSDCQGAGK